MILLVCMVVKWSEHADADGGYGDGEAGDGGDDDDWMVMVLVMVMLMGTTVLVGCVETHARWVYSCCVNVVVLSCERNLCRRPHMCAWRGYPKQG